MSSTKSNTPYSWEGKDTSLLTQEERAYRKTIGHTLGGKSITIGVITWNVGDNLNPMKMKELKEKYNQEYKIYPDILIVGFQEMPVDFSFRSTRSHFKETFYQKTGELLTNEFSDYDLISTYRKTYPLTGTVDKSKSLNLFTCAGFVSSLGGGFGIATYILKSKYFNESIEPVSVKDICFGGTKGYCVVTLLIAKKYDIDIINTHMPFESKKKMEKFSKVMLQGLHAHGFKSENQIIIGDLNSRSLLTDDCYAKKVTTCDNEENKYCVLKDRLESMSFDDSVQKVSQASTIELKQLTDSNCNIDKRVSQKRLLAGENQSQDKIQDLIQILVKSDVLHVNMNNLFPDFRESEIMFLPTYKRDLDSGIFSLQKTDGKKVDGRLPGFADRILVKGNIKPNYSYNLLAVKGNDHLPVSAFLHMELESGSFPILKTKTATKKGGSQRRTRKTRKTRRTRRTRKSRRR